MAVSRQSLVDDFFSEAKIHYGGEIEPSLSKLLGQLIDLVPDEAYTLRKSGNVVLLLGEIDKELAEEVIEELWDAHERLKPGEPIEVILSSDGGDVTSGSAIMAVLGQLRKERFVNVHVAGSAHSTAFDLVQCFDHRSAEPTASFMSHHEHFDLPEDASAISHKTEGDASIKRSTAVFTETAKRTGRPVSYYLEKIEHGEWYLSADEALEEGLIDEIAIHRPFQLTPARAGREQPAEPKAKKPRVRKAKTPAQVAA